MYSYTPAEVAELVDAPASGAGELMLVEVQVLFSAPNMPEKRLSAFPSDVIKRELLAPKLAFFTLFGRAI